ncbi:ash family protein [Aeromonas salmonicida]
MHLSKATDPRQQLHPWINSDSLYLAAAKSVVGRRNPRITKEPTHAPIAWFFVGVRSPFLWVLLAYLLGGPCGVMAVRAGQPQGWPGSFVSGFLPLSGLPPMSVGTPGGRENLTTKEAAIMATVPTLATSKIFTFLLAPRSCRVAELRRPCTVSTTAFTEAEARTHLPGLPLVFLSRRPVGEVAA